MSEKEITLEGLDAFYTKFWDNVGYGLNPVELRRWRYMRNCVERFAPKQGEHRLLDYGCGRGILLPLMSRYGEVDAYDITSSVLERVRGLYPRVNVFSGDGGYPTPLAAESYSVVVCSEVIEHVEDQAAFVGDIYRVLKPGGLLVLTTPNGRWETRFKSGTRGLQPVENWLTRGRLRDVVSRAGFRVTETGTFATHWSCMPYQRATAYTLFKRAARRYGFWPALDALENQCASWLGRGITLYLAAVKGQ